MASKDNFKVNGWSFKLCSSRKNSYLPHGRLSEDPQGKGVLQVKILEAKYEANLEFLGGGGGGKTKNLPWGKCGYFLELHIVRN